MDEHKRQCVRHPLGEEPLTKGLILLSIGGSDCSLTKLAGEERGSMHEIYPRSREVSYRRDYRSWPQLK